MRNGQVYGYEKTNPDDILAMQMPVEECGNMLISLYAVIKYGGNRDVADKNKQILKQWADYLVKYGYNTVNSFVPMILQVIWRITAI